MIHGTKAAIDNFSKDYTKYSLKRTTVSGWKERCKKNDLHSIEKRGKPNLVDDAILKKIKDVIIGSRLAGTVISQKMVVPIGTGAVKANEPKILREFVGNLELTEDWARNVLKDMNWVKRKGTTGNVKPRLIFLEEEKFTFERAVLKFVSDHEIPLEFLLNLDQSSLSDVSPGKCTFDLKG